MKSWAKKRQMVSSVFMHLLGPIHPAVLREKKTQKKCFKTFMDTSSDVLRAFPNLGRGVELPSTETVAALEKNICQLYCPKG